MKLEVLKTFLVSCPEVNRPQLKKFILEYQKNPRAVAAKGMIPWKHFSEFERKVYRALLKVTAGKTVTYGGLAKKAGYPGAARAVGSAMRKNPFPILIPCHRVVKSGGTIGRYSRGMTIKRKLLLHEGVSYFK